MYLIPEPDGYTAQVLRVDPTEAHVADPLFKDDRDVSVWLVEDAMLDHKARNLRTVRESLLEWMLPGLATLGYGRSVCRLMADVHIRAALHHPDTPFAIAYHHERDDVQSLVIYRGQRFLRDSNGALIPTGERDDWTPTRARWFQASRMAKRWLEDS